MRSTPLLLALCALPCTVSAAQVFRFAYSTGAYAELDLSPWNCSLPRVHLWGAGGGGAYRLAAGGGGAYVTGFLPLPPSARLRIIVGRGGKLCGDQGLDSMGGGGQGDAVTVNWKTGSGGGRSAIQLWNTTRAQWAEMVTAQWVETVLGTTTENPLFGR